MSRLLPLFLALLFLAACFEVDQRIVLRGSGAVDHTVRITQPAPKLAPIPEKAQAFLDQVNASPFGERVRAFVSREDKSLTWTIEARLLNAAEYRAWREAFIAATKERYGQDVGFLRPPELRGLLARELVVELPPEIPTEPIPGVEDTRNVWRLTVVASKGVASHNADRVEADGSLVWERPLKSVLYDGVQAQAQERMGWTPVALGLAAAALAALAAGWWARRALTASPPR